MMKISRKLKKAPAFTRRRWTDEENNLLLKVLSEKKGREFTEEDAFKLFKRTRIACKLQYHKLFPAKRKHNPWSAEESTYLKNKAEEYKKTNNVIPWHALAKDIGRSLNSVYVKWNRCLDPNIKQGPFNQDEIKRLFYLIKKHGKNWNKVAEEMEDVSILKKSTKNFRHENTMEKIEKLAVPIYALLDDHNNKSALALCNKTLKKHPDAHLILALKSLALNRSDKSSEAVEICEDLIKHGTKLDDSTIYAMILTLKTNGKHKECAQLLKMQMDRSVSSNESIMTSLFMAHVRGNDFENQQKMAALLFQKFKKTRYMYWNICTFMLQSCYDPSKAMSLTLAEKMITKLYQDNRVTTSEQFKLYLEILELQKSFGKIIECLDSDKGKSLVKLDFERQKMKLKFLQILEDWEQVFKVALEVFQMNPDDFHAFQLCFEAAEKSGISGFMEQLESVVSDLVEQGKSEKYIKRGPHLARIYMSKANNEFIKEYLDLFGTKPVCFPDIYPHIDNVSVDYLQTMRRPCDSVKAIYFNLCLEKIMRVKNNGLIESEKVETRIKEYLMGYEKALEFGKNLKELELQPADDYLIFATHDLFKLFKCTGDSQYLFQVVSHLSKGMQHSKANFQMKLLAIQAYIQMGAFTLANKVYEALDIKSVLHDTIGHYLTNLSIFSGCFNVDLLTKSGSFYQANIRETPEMICQAFNNETFSKVREFIDFERRVDLSLQKLINSHLLNIANVFEGICKSSIISNPPVTNPDVLKFSHEFIQTRVDNRDFKIISSWEPKGEKSIYELTRVISPDFSSWLRLHGYLEATIRSETKSEFEKLVSEISKAFQDFGADNDSLCRHYHVFVNEKDFKSAFEPLSKPSSFLGFQALFSVFQRVEVAVFSLRLSHTAKLLGSKIIVMQRDNIKALLSECSTWIAKQRDAIKNVEVDDDVKQSWTIALNNYATLVDKLNKINS